MRYTLSKSDFALARTCPTKLFYRESGYPSASADDPYVEMLANGGYMVEKLAKLLVPDAVDADRGVDLEGGIAATEEALRAAEVTVLEATLRSGAKLARVDILAKRGNRYQLVEVKSGGCDSTALQGTGEPGVYRAPATGTAGLPGRWEDYLTDVAFQAHVLREVVGPDAEIRAALRLPDKARSTSAELIHRRFHLRRVEDRGFERVEVEFDGDVEALRAGDHFLATIDVTAEVEARLAAVAQEADALAATLVPRPRRIARALDVDCGACEFRVADPAERSGFRECWGALGDVDPHLLDLYHVGSKPVRPRAAALIQAGRASLYDLSRDDLRAKTGAISARGERQWVQIDHTRRNLPWIGSALGDAIASVRYPLYFIDFETSKLAVPYHAGMHPWEVVAFQWSCHRIARAGGTAEHFEWINTEDPVPNRAFTSTLRARLGDQGTVLTWSGHELRVLREIAAQERGRGDADAALDAFVASLEAGRLLDMYALCLAEYFHPAMRGRTTIKAVLAALWESDATMRGEFAEYAASRASPYAALPPLEIGGRTVAVAEGTEAVTAYQEMLYGEHRDDPGARERLRDALLRYCGLDTAAMVMIWRYWERVVAEQESR